MDCAAAVRYWSTRIYSILLLWRPPLLCHGTPLVLPRILPFGCLRLSYTIVTSTCPQVKNEATKPINAIGGWTWYWSLFFVFELCRKELPTSFGDLSVDEEDEQKQWQYPRHFCHLMAPLFNPPLGLLRWRRLALFFRGRCKIKEGAKVEKKKERKRENLLFSLPSPPKSTLVSWTALLKLRFITRTCTECFSAE